MNAQDIDELISQIRGLVRSIPRDVGMYASLSEGVEPTGEAILSVYLDEEKGPHIMQAGTDPQDDEMSLKEMRDALLEWITKRRKAA